jgi:AcrR family transcriptional regulator
MQVLKGTTTYRALLRERILERAMQDFANHGIRSVRMDDIAKSLGVSKRTVYEIFGDKEAMLFEGLKIYEERKRTYLQHYAEENGHHSIDIILEAYRMKVEEVRAVNPSFYTDLMKYPKLEGYMKQRQAQARDGYLKFMQRGVEEGYLRPDINYEMIPLMFEAIGQYVLSNQLLQKYSVEELFSNYFLIALRGLCTSKGLEIIDEVMSDR